MISWNCNRAASSRRSWEYLLELAPDVALLQEVGSIPESVKALYSVQSQIARKENGAEQSFMTVVLAKPDIQASFQLSSRLTWVQRELQWFSGNFVSCLLRVDPATHLRVVSVYSPAWPVAKGRLVGEDVTEVKLTLNKDVWAADLLWAALREILPNRKEPWIIAGDFNCSETFDAWKDGPRGNKEYLDRMKHVGLTECLRHHQGRLVPTYLNKDGKTHEHQMDHLFVTGDLASVLVDCKVGDNEVVFQQKLSDHLPIVADFSFVGPSTRSGGQT